MAIRITCPGCKNSLTLDDDKRGKKVRCRHCEKVLSIPAAKTDAEEPIEENRNLKTKAAPVPEETEQDEEEQRPAKKKKKKNKKAAAPVLFIAAGVGVFVLLLGGAAGFTYYLMKSEPAVVKNDPQAKLDEKAKKNNPGGDGAGALPINGQDKKNDGGVRIAPKIEDGSPTKKGGTGIVTNVRGAVYRAERRSELGQLRLAYVQFADDFKGAGRTKENFLEYIKTFGAIHVAVKEGYYQINLKAQLVGDNIIAYERDEDHTGHLCVRANGDMPNVRAAQLKQELGIP